MNYFLAEDNIFFSSRKRLKGVNKLTNLLCILPVDSHLATQYKEISLGASSNSNSFTKLRNYLWFFPFLHMKFTISKTVFITSSYLKCLVARCSPSMMQYIGRNSGKLGSHFINPINPTRLPTIAGAPSVATLTSL